MKRMGIALLGLAIILAATPALAYQVYSSGPLDSAFIDFFIQNDGAGDISKVTFDLSSTQSIASGNPPLVMEPTTFDQVFTPSGGTYSEFLGTAIEPDHYYIFGFTFTGFSSGTTFQFSWDPDIVGDYSYGATISELVGTQVSLETGTGTLVGSMIVSGDHLVVNFVPLPPTVLLLGSGLLGLAGWRRVRKS